MTISAGSLFHFTDTYEKLLGILNSNFHPQYCLERRDELFPNLKGSLILNSAVPMVCFCDIPLSQIREHVQDYGEYGIGLNKEWASVQRLNPVIYLTPGSQLADHIYGIIDKTFAKAATPAEVDERYISSFAEILAFIKPYSGIHYRNGRAMRTKVFYDEKEWRFIPKIGSEPGLYFRLDLNLYADLNKRQKANQALAEKRQLYFEPKDINHILISKEDEILPLIKAIQDEKGKKYSFRDITILTSKILTVDKVKRDF